VSISGALQALWYARSRPPWVLRLLSGVFGSIVRLRTGAYQRRLLRVRRIAVPVVVVGNVAVGGTGKTPLVIWLVERLQTAGFHPGVVLRGYGGTRTRDKTPQRVTPDSDPVEVGDEAVLLALRTRVPVMANRNRAEAAQRLVEEGVDVVISDDGLQHLALARDFEVVVIDAERRLGNGFLLPAGPLREPASRLQRSDCVVINGSSPGAAEETMRGTASPQTAPLVATMHVNGDTVLALSGSQAPLVLAQFAGQRVHALAGIGNPARFFATLRAAHINVIEHALPDHHQFQPQDLEFDDGLAVLMTEKDAVKCRRFAAARCWYLPVSASLPADDAAALLARLQAALEIRRR
jgi:tetraacyldisaccharide 4'-kinase